MMNAEMNIQQAQVVSRLAAAINTHDLDALLACFSSDFDSQQPNHPERNFHGKESVQKNWTALFQTVPRLRAQVLSMSAAGQLVMVEWRWDGVQRDGAAWNQQGVTVLHIEDDSITWARLYMNPTPA